MFFFKWIKFCFDPISIIFYISGEPSLMLETAASIFQLMLIVLHGEESGVWRKKKKKKKNKKGRAIKCRKIKDSGRGNGVKKLVQILNMEFILHLYGISSSKTKPFISNVKEKPSINLRTSFNTVIEFNWPLCCKETVFKQGGGGEAAIHLSCKFIAVGNWQLMGGFLFLWCIIQGWLVMAKKSETQSKGLGSFEGLGDFQRKSNPMGIVEGEPYNPE